MLDVGADDSGGGFGAEGEGLGLLAGCAGAVFPGEHFFADDVGFFAYAAGEEFGGFEDRGADFAEAVAGEEGSGGGLDVVPERGLVGEEVAGAADGLEGGTGRGFLGLRRIGFAVCRGAVLAVAHRTTSLSNDVED